LSELADFEDSTRILEYRMKASLNKGFTRKKN